MEVNRNDSDLENDHRPTKLWGEISDSDEESPEIPDVRADIEICMRKCALGDEAEAEEAPQLNEHFTLPPIDPLIAYAIALHKHTNDMIEMIRLAELALESHVIPPADGAPQMPALATFETSSEGCYRLLPRDEEVNTLELSPQLLRKLLTKAVATICAHIGYETTHQSVLDILVDVLDEFLTKICYHYKVAEEDNCKGHFSGFPSTIERVLVELGLDGTKGLHEFYHNRIAKYIPVLQRRCNDLHKHYKMLITKKAQLFEEAADNIIQVNVGENDAHNHFAIDGGLGFLSLEPGFQLLHSLDGETSTQTAGDGISDAGIIIAPTD